MVATAPVAPDLAGRPRTSAAWSLVLAAVGVVVALGLGLLLQALFDRARGDLLVPYVNRSHGIAFSYPVYDDVRVHDDQSFSTIDVAPHGDDSYFESATTDFSRKVDFFVILDQEDPASSLPYRQAHCTTGPETDSKGVLEDTIVRATLTTRTVHGHPAVVCSTAQLYAGHTSDDDLQLVIQAEVALTDHSSASVQLITYGKTLSAKQQSIIDRIIDSVHAP